MQGYASACCDEAFTGAREHFAETEEWLAGEAAGLQHAELEEQLEARGRELVRRLFQGHLDLLAVREERRGGVAGEDGVVRTRAERGRTRPLVTKFGQVSVSRIAYRSPGRSNMHPLDAALNLPEEKHSHGLRKMAAIGAARGSMEAAGAAITRATGVTIGKRQVEELARRCAAHVEAFYLQRVTGQAPDGCPLILTFGGKGIVMLPEALRPATAKAAASAEGKLATRLSPGGEERPQADVRAGLRLRRDPGPARAGGRHQHCGAEAAEEESAGREAERQGKAARTAGKGQVADRLGHRRHPRSRRRRVR